ncbi:MAG TPA: HlyD family efflux transporter periplasmic adaptor subunit [Thermoanaerobaculia bacterium]
MRHESHAVDGEVWKPHPVDETTAATRTGRSMDIVREEQPKSLARKYWYVPVAILVLFAFVGAKRYLGSASYIAQRADLTVSVVQQGDFAVNIRANGKLKSRDVFFLASRVSGSVGQILVKAGEPVDVETPIVSLVNPQLTIDLVQARAKLRQVMAERQVELKTVESALLDQEIQLLSAKNSLQSSQRELNSKTELSKFGDGLVSAMDMQQAKASVETQQQIYALSQQRVQQMRGRVEAQRMAQNLEIEQLQENINNVQTQIDQLVVRAGMKGTLQSLAVSPGQKLNIGDSVGVVADTTHLIAQLQVPELQVQRVSNGLPVTIDTRRSKIQGRVIRVAPSVQGGMVEVDVALDENAAIPAEARADLSVEGMIHVVELKNVLFMDRPDFAKADASQNLYRLTADESRATRIPLTFGEASVNQIQILRGVQPGDKVITSDTSAFASHDSVIVN